MIDQPQGTEAQPTGPDRKDGDPISYLALQEGTPVRDSDGTQFGSVARVLTVESEDVFDGISVQTDAGLAFVSRDQIDTITTGSVRTTVRPDQVGELPEPEGTPAYRADAAQDDGPGIGAKLNRLVRGERWEPEDQR